MYLSGKASRQHLHVHVEDMQCCRSFNTKGWVQEGGCAPSHTEHKAKGNL